MNRTRIVVGAGGRQRQADWNETDPTSPSYIKNRPDISGTLTHQFVDELPVEDIDPNCIYFVEVQDPVEGNHYDEYMYNEAEQEWEQVGSTAVNVTADHPFKSEWHTDTTLAAFIADVNADTDAVEGTYFSGELTCTGLPNEIGNAECRVDVLTGSTSLDKIFVLTIYSTNVAPYHYELMVDGGVAGTWHWTGDGTITVQRNGQTAGSFTTNQNNNTTIDIEVPEYTSDLINDTDVYLTEEEYEALEQAGQLDEDVNYHIQGNIPTKTSDLTNDSGYITINDVPTQVNADWNASSGAAEILNKPTIPAAQVNSDWNASSGVAEILNKPNNLDLVVPFTQNGSTVSTTVSTSDIMSAITAGQGVYATLDDMYLTLSAYQSSTPEKIIFSGMIGGIETIITGKVVSSVWTWTLTENDLNNTTNAWYGTQAEYDMLGADALIEGKDYYIETELAKVATTGQYADLKGAKPSAPVAYSNDYQDLSNAPTPTQSTYFGRQDLDWYGTQAEFDALEQAGQLEFYRNYYIEGEGATNVVTGYGAAYTIRYISQTDYDNLGTYDANTIYLIY